MPDYTEVTLETLNSGAAVELFESALGRILQNIGDPSTKADAVREIKLIVKVHPNEERTAAVTTVSVATKLAEPVSHTSFVQLGSDGQHVHALVTDPKQKPLPFPGASAGGAHGA